MHGVRNKNEVVQVAPQLTTTPRNDPSRLLRPLQSLAKSSSSNLPHTFSWTPIINAAGDMLRHDLVLEDPERKVEDEYRCTLPFGVCGAPSMELHVLRDRLGSVDFHKRKFFQIIGAAVALREKLGLQGKFIVIKFDGGEPNILAAAKDPEVQASCRQHNVRVRWCAARGVGCACSFAAHADGSRVVAQLLKYGSERTPEDQECDRSTIFRDIKGAIVRITAVDGIIDQEALELAVHLVDAALANCTLQTTAIHRKRNDIIKSIALLGQLFATQVTSAKIKTAFRKAGSWPLDFLTKLHNMPNYGNLAAGVEGTVVGALPQLLEVWKQQGTVTDKQMDAANVPRSDFEDTPAFRRRPVDERPLRNQYAAEVTHEIRLDELKAREVAQAAEAAGKEQRAQQKKAQKAARGDEAKAIAAAQALLPALDDVAWKAAVKLAKAAVKVPDFVPPGMDDDDDWCCFKCVVHWSQWEQVLVLKEVYSAESEAGADDGLPLRNVWQQCDVAQCALCPACFKTAANVKTHETMCGQGKRHRERLRARGVDVDEAEALGIALEEEEEEVLEEE